MAVKTYENLNIAEAAYQSGFRTLIEAAKKAGLYDLLVSGQDITVFAPDDHAFNLIQTGVTGSFLKIESRERIADILKYHIVSHAMTSDQVVSVDDIEMMNGEMVEVFKRDHTILINNSRIIQPDIYAKNGIIHSIDKVLMPE
ncbi:MAG: hypothetical protein A2Y25_07730 [Candidatus Melainabacteria bacterium GWF2_37_15]|nr:MAG: hypothetical protein A2Y25_07730 [Candidatus Melainabacteria bacterium GWF2_37_15]